MAAPKTARNASVNEKCSGDEDRRSIDEQARRNIRGTEDETERCSRCSLVACRA